MKRRVLKTNPACGLMLDSPRREHQAIAIHSQGVLFRGPKYRGKDQLGWSIVWIAILGKEARNFSDDFAERGFAGADGNLRPLFTPFDFHRLNLGRQECAFQEPSAEMAIGIGKKFGTLDLHPVRS